MRVRGPFHSRLLSQGWPCNWKELLSNSYMKGGGEDKGRILMGRPLSLNSITLLCLTLVLWAAQGRQKVSIPVQPLQFWQFSCSMRKVCCAYFSIYTWWLRDVFLCNLKFYLPIRLFLALHLSHK